MSLAFVYVADISIQNQMPALSIGHRFACNPCGPYVW